MYLSTAELLRTALIAVVDFSQRSSKSYHFRDHMRLINTQVRHAIVLSVARQFTSQIVSGEEKPDAPLTAHKARQARRFCIPQVANSPVEAVT